MTERARNGRKGFACRGVAVCALLYFGIVAAAAQPATVTTNPSLHGEPVPSFRVLSSMPRGARAGGPQCRAERAHFIVGRRATERRLERARSAARARTLRVERPDRFYTQEFRADRLSVSVNRRNVVVGVACR